MRNLKSRMWIQECGFWNAESKMQNLKFQILECGVSNAECGMQKAEGRRQNPKCGIQTPECAFGYLRSGIWNTIALLISDSSTLPIATSQSGLLTSDSQLPLPTLGS